MQKINLGTTNEKISICGLGTMYFGTKLDKKTSFRLMDIYLEKGGSFFDSANKYASWVPGFEGGESETVLGEWLKERGNREQVFVTSKVGFPYGDVSRSLKKDIIIAECERSLKRLKLDRIDLYFAHSYDEFTPIAETMEAFRLLKKQGKIRYAGASNFPSWRLEEANTCATRDNWEGFVCLQQRHSYLEPNLRAAFGNQLFITPEIEDYCQSKQVTLMGYSPLLGGAYSRKDRPMPQEYQSPNSEQRLQALKRISTELKVSENHIVLSWMLHSSPLVMPIISGSSEDQIKENIEGINISLTPTQMKELNILS